jgi:hypothetical protein
MNIGREYNIACSRVPEDEWICITDQDVCFLRPDTKKQIEDIVHCSGDEYSLLGCYTNRVGLLYQCHGGAMSCETDINIHRGIASSYHRLWYRVVEPQKRIIAGFLMLFPKKVWNYVKFEENSIYFDQKFSTDVMAMGGKIGLMKGVYVWHSYRLGHPNPRKYTEHLKR